METPLYWTEDIWEILPAALAESAALDTPSAWDMAGGETCGRCGHQTLRVFILRTHERVCPSCYRLAQERGPLLANLREKLRAQFHRLSPGAKKFVRKGPSN